MTPEATPISRQVSLFYGVFSPILLIGVCAGIQVAAGKVVGVWAWVPTMLVFWMVIAALLRGYSRQASVTSRFRPALGSLIWSVLAVAAGLLSLHGFLRHWSLLAELHLILAWAVFALVNSWFEESYWRGLLMDSTASWGKFFSLVYSAVLFAVSHPLIWGVHSLPLRKIESLGALLLVGLIWGLAYQRTQTLRWCVVGHMLANLFGLAALVLLNLYDPTVRQP
jgi:membrane protease YdiL (CAAX protease family)